MATATENGSLMLTDKERSSVIEFINTMGGDASDFATKSGKELPQELIDIINQVTHAIMRGTPLSITTMPEELTTTNAAALLDISRPTLMKHIRDGRVPAHKVGTHHRLKSRDVLQFAEEMKREHRQAVFDLMDLDDEGTHAG